MDQRRPRRRLRRAPPARPRAQRRGLGRRPPGRRHLRRAASAACSAASRCSTATTDASKVALGRPRRAPDRGPRRASSSVQHATPHLRSLGAIEIPREVYVGLLTELRDDEIAPAARPPARGPAGRSGALRGVLPIRTSPRGTTAGNCVGSVGRSRRRNWLAARRSARAGSSGQALRERRLRREALGSPLQAGRQGLHALLIQVPRVAARDRQRVVGFHRRAVGAVGGEGLEDVGRPRARARSRAGRRPGSRGGSRGRRGARGGRRRSRRSGERGDAREDARGVRGWSLIARTPRRSASRACRGSCSGCRACRCRAASRRGAGRADRDGEKPSCSPITPA